jgi:hypothetical protein
VTLSRVVFGKATFEPGWRWSQSVKPIAGTDSCQVHHNGYVVSGRMHVVMDDGSEGEAGPGDVIVIPPGPRRLDGRRRTLRRLRLLQPGRPVRQAVAGVQPSQLMTGAYVPVDGGWLASG